MKTSELSGAALDWAVAKCEAESAGATLKLETFTHMHGLEFLCFSTDWSQGGPIIEREKLATNYSAKRSCWFAEDYQEKHAESGPTPLIAAMRCYVASKLGDDIELPKELT